MFVALKGDNFNGNAFAARALESGCRYAVIDEPQYMPAGDNRYLLVDDCLKALQTLAREHRRKLGTKIIGITGTNGKTTTKELMAAVLGSEYRLLYTEGNLNNHIGVPLTLLRLKPEHEMAIVEMGASHPGDIKELVEIAEPDYGLITNVGRAHLLGFGSFEGVMRTKGELYDYLRTGDRQTIFIDNDNEYLKPMAEGLRMIRYGTTPEAHIEGRVMENTLYLKLGWRQSHREEDFRPVCTRLVGEYNFKNVLAAITVGCYFGVPPEKIDQALEAYTPQNNRSQLKETKRNTLIIDAYNANPTSMRASIENFHHLKAEHKMLILGDMRELGEESSAEHRKIVELLEGCNFTDVRLVGECFTAAGSSYPCYPDAPALIEALQAERPEGKTILIKGSNSIRLSTVTEYL